ncbi:unnamed protein product, partial [marine sediment metagenome]
TNTLKRKINNNVVKIKKEILFLRTLNFDRILSIFCIIISKLITPNI